MTNSQQVHERHAVTIADLRNILMKDLEKAEHVELLQDSTGKVWVNVDGVCILRVGKVENVHYNRT